eukprot:CAMPEP_0114561576 /NCGR_PEP_ID=MMETSP0114-20121206/12077_1 /TAXON_ID=31324 /ORGANISM="Goniomonas sp, Strain m" /LENGTH=263 /DNA_ID=CAMNT_0001747219 /DNA_START=19 /DNA_END=810 /DNA_ORIENTATION=-
MPTASFLMALALLPVAASFPVEVSVLQDHSNCTNADSLPIDGTPATGSLNYMEYKQYYVYLEQSGDLTLTQTITGGSQYGVWNFAARGYQPVDGKSDWDFGTISSQSESKTLKNLEVGVCYYIAVAHLETDSVSYSLVAKLTPQTWKPPTNLTVDDMPFAAPLDAWQYTDFMVTPSFNGNISVEVNIVSGRSSVALLALPQGVPRLGNFLVKADESKEGEWKSLPLSFMRKDVPIGIAVTSSGDGSIDIKVVCTGVYGGGQCP